MDSIRRVFRVPRKTLPPPNPPANCEMAIRFSKKIDFIAVNRESTSFHEYVEMSVLVVVVVVVVAAACLFVVCLFFVFSG